MAFERRSGPDGAEGAADCRFGSKTVIARMSAIGHKRTSRLHRLAPVGKSPPYGGHGHYRPNDKADPKCRRVLSERNNVSPTSRAVNGPGQKRADNCSRE